MRALSGFKAAHFLTAEALGYNTNPIKLPEGAISNDPTATRGIHETHGPKIRRHHSCRARSHSFKRHAISLSAGLGLLLSNRIRRARVDRYHCSGARTEVHAVC